MNYPAVTNVPMPADLAREMEVQAAKYGMDLPTFLAFLARVQINRLDRGFVDATRFVFRHHSESLRKLAQ